MWSMRRDNAHAFSPGDVWYGPRATRNNSLYFPVLCFSLYFISLSSVLYILLRGYICPPRPVTNDARPWIIKHELPKVTFWLWGLPRYLVSSYFTKHWTKFLTHQTGNYPVCFVSKPSRITLVELSIINTSYQKLPFGSSVNTPRLSPPH